MMGRFVCVVSLALFMANVANGAAQEQDDWGFAAELNNSYSVTAPFQASSVPAAVAPSFQFGPQPAFGPRYYGPQSNFYTPRVTTPRTFGPAPGWYDVYQPAPSVRFF